MEADVLPKELSQQIVEQPRAKVSGESKFLPTGNKRSLLEHWIKLNTEHRKYIKSWNLGKYIKSWTVRKPKNKNKPSQFVIKVKASNIEKMNQLCAVYL